MLSRVNPENVYSINCFAGGSVGYFFTGVTGNSPMLNAQAECVMAHRITLPGGLGYLFPFESSKDSTYKVGGLTPQLGMGLSW